jgi:putative endonuclease
MTKSRELGARGEEHAAKHLEQAGYRIRDRNWRCRAGEIDIVAELDDVVAVVEVKTRTGHGAGHPFEAVTASKAARLARLSRAWSAENGLGGRRLRIDVIGVTVVPSGAVVVEHLEGIGG